MRDRVIFPYCSTSYFVYECGLFIATTTSKRVRNRVFRSSQRISARGGQNCIPIVINLKTHCDDCYRHIAASHPAPHRLVQLYRCSTSYSVCNCRCDKMATTMPYGVLRTGGDVLGYIGAGVRGRVSMVMAMRMA